MFQRTYVNTRMAATNAGRGRLRGAPDCASVRRSVRGILHVVDVRPRRAFGSADGRRSCPRRVCRKRAAAISLCHSVVRRGPPTRRVRVGPTRACSLQSGVSYEALGLRDRALGDLDAAIALLPQFPNSYIYRALIWTDRREFDLARDDLLQALRLIPDSALIRNNLGSVYERKGELDLAIENYGTAIRLDPAYAEAFYNRAHAFIAMHDYQAAVTDYDRAIALQKDFADAYSNRGGVYLMQGDIEKAIADFGEAIRLRESDPIFWANRANAYLALGRYKEAIDDFDRAHKIDPGNATVYLGRGRARMYSNAIAAAGRGSADRRSPETIEP